MSLFDVLRYPISIPPQPGQLEAIPDEIFKVWYDSIDGWRDYLYDRDVVRDYYCDRCCVHALWELDSLRNMIKDYEPF